MLGLRVGRALDGRGLLPLVLRRPRPRPPRARGAQAAVRRGQGEMLTPLSLSLSLSLALSHLRFDSSAVDRFVHVVEMGLNRGKTPSVAMPVSASCASR